jgi:hypothetical protein
MMFAGRKYRLTAQAHLRFARKTRNAGGDEHGSGPSQGARARRRAEVD